MTRGMLLVLGCALSIGCGASDDEREPPGGAGGTIPGWRAGCEQAPACTASISSRIDGICVEGACRSVESRARGSLLVYARLPFELHASAVRGYSITVLHPTRPDGGALDCDGVLALAPQDRRNAGWTNAMGWSTGAANLATGDDTIAGPANGIPVTEDGERYLVLVEFHAQAPEMDGTPRGAIVAEGCAGGLEVLEGHYRDHPGDERWAFVVETDAV